MGIKNKVQLITYPNSLGKDLKELDIALNTYFDGVFEGGVHILPPFPSSGDRGFAPISYFEIEKEFGTWEDIEAVSRSHDIVIDLMVNHISRQSEPFQDFLRNGPESKYKNLFITLDKIWEDGRPVQKDIDRIFLRRERPYSEYEAKGYGKVKVWTTFGKTEPSEQIDIDIHSDEAKAMFESILKNFSSHGVKIVRLDAVGYVIKKPGTSCFFVEPEIYDFLNWISGLAAKYGLALLPEVHAHYSIQYKLAERGYWIYDFILPFRILEALLLKRFDRLGQYLKERPSNQFTMLDCHDGLPVMPDLNDLVEVKDAAKIVDICMERGSNLSKVYSDAHKLEGGFDVHQIRGTIYSMLGENDDDYILARAIQFFTPGIPQVYYVGLLAGVNQYDLAEKTGDGREINRYNYSLEEIGTETQRGVVKRLIRLIRFRNQHPSFDGTFYMDHASENELAMSWVNGDEKSRLVASFKENTAYIEYSVDGKLERYQI